MYSLATGLAAMIASFCQITLCSKIEGRIISFVEDHHIEGPNEEDCPISVWINTFWYNPHDVLDKVDRRILRLIRDYHVGESNREDPAVQLYISENPVIKRYVFWCDKLVRIILSLADQQIVTGPIAGSESPVASLSSLHGY